jgi:hypothetical protein
MTATQPDTLFSLSEEMQALDALLNLSAGELTPEIEALLATLQDKITDKADSCGWYAKTLEAEVQVATEHAAHFLTKQTVAKRKLEAWKSYLATCLTYLGAKELKGRAYTIALQQNGGEAPLEIHEPFKSDPSQLPEMLKLVKVSPDTKAIRSALSQGVFLDVATLLPRGSHVRVR